MKKAKKRRPQKTRKRARPKQAAPARKKTAPAGRSPSAAAFASPFDFAAPEQADPGLVPRARELLGAGRPREALALLRQALAASPNDAEACNLAGVAAFQSGQPDEAADLLQTACAFAPDNAEAWTNLGNVLGAAGRVGEAKDAYRAAMRADPRHAGAPFNFAILLAAQGRHGEALKQYERTLEIAPSHAAAALGRADVLKGAGRLDDARAAYGQAIKRNPASPAARTNLAAVLQELGDFKGAAEQCRLALNLAPDMAEARYNLGIALQEQQQYEDAIGAYEQVLAAQPDNAAAALNIAYGLQQTGRLDEAEQAFRRTLAIDPDFAKAHVNLADLKLQQGAPEAALAVCDEFLARHPASTDLLAFRAVALWDLDRAEEARKLIDFGRLVRVIRIKAPAAFAGLEEFNAALTEHVLAHPTLTYAPQSHATREGRHSGELLTEPRGPIAHLETAIRAAAEDYRNQAGTDPDHPFLAAPPKKLDLSVWGVVMQSAGHQIPHIHPAAWLSGVYYPKVPDVVKASAGKAGWIAFGKPPEHFHNTVEPEVMAVEPEPGLMVLFPSYFYHHTVPFEAEGTRISIAFDLMPA